MRTKALLTVAVVAMLLVGVAAEASNMGFKINIRCTYKDGSQNIAMLSFPYYVSFNGNSSPTSDDFLEEFFGTFGDVYALTYFDNSLNYWVTQTIYAPGVILGDGTFSLVAGESYQVQFPGSGTDGQNWDLVIVGSHNPAVTGWAFTPVDGKGNLFHPAFPYHTTYTDSDVVLEYIMAHQTNTTADQPVAMTRWDNSLNYWVTQTIYAPGVILGDGTFSLAPGEGYEIQLGYDASNPTFYCSLNNPFY